MPVGGEQLVAGPYTCTWNGAPLGIFEGDDRVPTIQQTPRAQRVENTDRWGRIPIDSVHLGAVTVFMGTLMEYPKALPVLWPFGIWGADVGPVGVLKYTLARPLVLTAISGTTAGDSPATLTAAKAIIADDFDVTLKFGPTVRVVPIKMDLFIYETSPNKFGSHTMT